MWAFTTAFLFLLSSCGGGGFKSADNSPSTQTFPEPEYCSNVTSYSPSITVTATAKYFYRPTAFVAGMSAWVLSGNPVQGNIAAAEVVVTNSAGAVVQCASTDDVGAISFTLPKQAGSYTISVRSRAYNSLLKASVLDDINANQPYKISGSINLSGGETNASAGTITAYARKSESAAIEGGAFSILRALYDTNKYIRTQTSQPSWVAEKVSVYWRAGFNPYAYFGYPDSPLSFYLMGKRQLFILGGLNGDVNTADTDHFDNTVVIHEYGHFLEDVYSKSNSPGGSHNGNMLLDPRLAWSEGWAYFLQGAVQGLNKSIDTGGYCNDTVETNGVCTQKVFLQHDQNGGTASYDAVSVAGEGTFREVSVIRTLYKAMQTTVSSSYPFGAAISFNDIWNVFSGTSTGFASTNVHFRSSGKFFNLLSAVVAGYPAGNQAAWTSILNNERQPNTTAYYADTLTAAASCAKFPKALTPAVDQSVGSYVLSNKLRSDHFYQYYYTGAANTFLTIDYTQGTGTTIDLDLNIYKETYSYFEQQAELAWGQSNNSVAVRSIRANPAIESGQEYVNMSGLPAGYYMINIKANSYGKTNAQLSTGTANYTLKETISGVVKELCPDN